jgi:pyruvate,orthophosphate dikinase
LAVEEATGKRFGDPSNPLLVSARSGAPVSMPGMMDTVLNLGVNQETLRGLVQLTGDERFAWDAYRRFVQMFGEIVLGVPAENLDKALTMAVKQAGVARDADLNVAQLQAMVFGNAGEDSGTGVAFTRDPSTGEPTLFGEYLTNAQGEDVVAGTRTPSPISELAELSWPRSNDWPSPIPCWAIAAAAWA